MNKPDVRYFVCAALFICLVAVQAPAQQDKSFNWIMSLQNAKTGEAVAFSAPIQSMTGEQFRLAIQPSAASYIYVIAESPNGNDVAVLFAGLWKSGETWYSDNFELTAPRGTESLFVIVSMDEQKTLAQRINTLQRNNGSSQRRALMNEVYRIRSDASKFKEAPEKPVLMGGSARGSEEHDQGVEFSGLATYVKTISIEH